MRRASASIPENIAEGSCRTENEFAHFLQIALGSASEVEYELLLAHDLGYINQQDHQQLHELAVYTKQMLGVFIRTIKTQKAGHNIRGALTDSEQRKAENPNA